MKLNQQGTAKKINEIFLSLPRHKRIQLYKKLQEALFREKLVIFDEKGKPRPIHITLRPWIITNQQKRLFLNISQQLKNSISKIYALYRNDPVIRELLPLNHIEKEWFFDINKKRLQTPQALVDRLDSNANFISADWQKFKFVEQNSVGIGGIFYIPAASRVIEKTAIPIIKKFLPGLKLRPQTDTRLLLYESLISHAKKLKLGRINIGFMQDTQMPEGTEELPHLCEYFNKKSLTTCLADPRNLHIKNGQLYHNDTPIDLLYRDSEIKEICSMGLKKENLSLIKWTFMHNRVVSSIAGEFDHKSISEIFTNEKFEKYFSQREHKLFRQHLLWTRLIFDRKTTDPYGNKTDLARYIDKNKYNLVIKPNRLYGGKGILLGRFCPASIWAKQINIALRNPYTKVIQSYVDCRQEEFPFITENGEVSLEKRFVVSGFLSNATDIAFLIRYSVEHIVNVSRKGGIVPVFAATN